MLRSPSNPTFHCQYPIPHICNVDILKSHEKTTLATGLLLVRLKDIGKTKRTHHCPWCGDDAYVLGWGVIKPHAIVVAKAARPHGDIVSVLQ
jgi:hypothetical protein